MIMHDDAWWSHDNAWWYMMHDDAWRCMSMHYDDSNNNDSNSDNDFTVYETIMIFKITITHLISLEVIVEVTMIVTADNNDNNWENIYMKATVKASLIPWWQLFWDE